MGRNSEGYVLPEIGARGWGGRIRGGDLRETSIFQLRIDGMVQRGGT